LRHVGCAAALGVVTDAETAYIDIGAPLEFGQGGLSRQWAIDGA